MRLLQTQESVNPYQSVLAPTDATEHPVTRAVYNNSASAVPYDFTFADGTTANIKMSARGLLHIAVKKVTTAGVILFLY